MKRICVFTGSSPGARPEYARGARHLAQALVESGIVLVYGGGSVGLMGVIADSVLEFGGEAIGVIPSALAEKELAHDGLTELHVVDSMHDRKALMAELADGFVAMPGGIGTLEELMEILTWAQLGIHQKPCGLLNVNGFYDPLVTVIDHCVQERFLREEHRGLLLMSDDSEQLLEQFKTWEPPDTTKWLDSSES